MNNMIDFEVNNIIFEVGGKNEKAGQTKDHSGNAYLVNVNILYGSKNEIPLYLFGFLY